MPYYEGYVQLSMGQNTRTVDTSKKLYAREREMRRLPIKLANGQEIRLSPGSQNVLVKKIMDHFYPLFTPGN